MGLVDFFSIRGRDTLHAVVASAKQTGAESIDDGVSHDIDDLGRGAAACIYFPPVPVSCVVENGPDGNANIDERNC